MSATETYYQHRIAELEAAIQRVRNLHTATLDPWDGDEFCNTCGNKYPCPTIKALDGDK